jgi:hypothetical protein
VGLLAIEARPDNAIVATLCPLLALLLLAPAPRLRPLFVWASVLGFLVLVDLMLKAHLLGTPLPLAFYAKQPWYYRGFVGEFTWNPFLFLEVALATASPFLVAAVLFSRRASVRVLLVLLIPAVATIAALFSVNQIMGHLGRFYFPSVPLFVVAGALVTDRWIQGLPDQLRSTEGAPRLARALLIRLACAWVAPRLSKLRVVPTRPAPKPRPWPHLVAIAFPPSPLFLTSTLGKLRMRSRAWQPKPRRVPPSPCPSMAWLAPLPPAL